MSLRRRAQRRVPEAGPLTSEASVIAACDASQCARSPRAESRTMVGACSDMRRCVDIDLESDAAVGWASTHGLMRGWYCRPSFCGQLLQPRG